MQLPELPNGMKWKVCVNTFVTYEDGQDVEALTEFQYKSTLRIPPRTVVVLEAQQPEEDLNHDIG